MPVLYTMVGLPASGKSTFIKEHFDNANIVSTDAIRKELYGAEEIQGNPREVFGIAYERIEKYLNEGKSVVFDATNLTPKDRKRALQFDAYQIAIFCNTPLEECKRRNANRERVVPENVIDRMAKKLTMPTLQEGFNEIYYKKGLDMVLDET